MATRLGRFIRGVTFRRFGCALAIWCGLVLVQEARGQTPSAATSLDALLRMSPTELEGLYGQGFVVAIPEGPIRGTALLRRGQGGRVPYREALGCSGRGRCSSRAGLPPSTASSGFGLSGPRSNRDPVGSTAVRPWCLTTAGHHASTPTIATRSVKSPPGYSWA